MRKIYLTLFALGIAYMTLESSTCKKPDVEPGGVPATTSGDNTSGTTVGTTGGTIRKTGDLRVTHRILTIAGNPAPLAECGIALSGDSLDNRQFVKTGVTDVDGVFSYLDMNPGIDYGLFAKHFHNGDTIFAFSYFNVIEQNKLRNANIVLE